MGSSSVANALEALQPYVYGGLFLVALVQWRRRPGRSSLWLVATFGVLAAVVLAGVILPEDSSDPAMEWVGRGLIAVLVLFPYFLYRFTTTLLPPIPWVNVMGTVLTASIAVIVFLLPSFPDENAPQPGWVGIFIIALLTQWVFLSAVVAIRLWRAGKGQPTVARRRMRTMALGATGLALALVVAGQFSGGEGIADVFFGLLVLGAAPLMLIGFAPPRALRILWRRREEAELREAGHSLMEAVTTQEVARILLPHARILLGAEVARLENEDGEIVASVDVNGDSAPGTDPAADRTSPDGPERPIVRVPMRKGQLVVHSSPLTPFFGDEELSELQELAALADLAFARNELLDSQRTLAAIVQSSDDAIISRTLDGTITSWNRGAEKIYGYEAGEAVGRSMSMLDPHGYDDVEIMERILRGESTDHYETERRTKEGKSIHVSLTISPVKEADGTISGVSVVARDVSERRRLDEERAAAHEEADRANHAKSEFLSRMSHELRTPLNSVLGFAQLMQMEPMAPKQEDATREILKAGTHLVELIDEVLDIARIEAGKLRLSLEPVDAVLVIDECISLLGPQAAQEGVHVAMGGPAAEIGSSYVIADRQRLKQVLLNLLSNGIKYNREHGSVTVSIERPAEGRRIRIDVADTGRGMPPERLDRLFSPFERLGIEGTGIQGTGLGLALSKPLVEAMGGTIEVSSELGRGSRFSLELASADDTAVAESIGSDDHHLVASVAPRTRTILYVEDNVANVKLMERILERRPGVQLISAMQGSLGVTLARDHQPDLIFLDLNLPDMGGQELLGRLKADPRTADLPVVVISADVTAGQHARLIEAGARDFVPKPFDVERLLGIVDEFCGAAVSEGAGNGSSNGETRSLIHPGS
ncbi:MAG TPA: ATP-binding protein [Actinomycetota bacterium]|nr:ATP-binding protein [Actinomycetota bacterium]